MPSEQAVVDKVKKLVEAGHRVPGNNAAFCQNHVAVRLGITPTPAPDLDEETYATAIAMRVAASLRQDYPRAIVTLQRASNYDEFGIKFASNTSEAFAFHISVFM